MLCLSVSAYHMPARGDNACPRGDRQGPPLQEHVTVMNSTVFLYGRHWRSPCSPQRLPTDLPCRDVAAGREEAELEDVADHRLDVRAIGYDHVLIGADGWIVDGLVSAEVLAAAAWSQRDAADRPAVQGAPKVREGQHLLLAEIGIDLPAHIIDQVREM